LKKENRKLSEVEEKKQSDEVSRRDFLVGAGTVVIGGAIGAGLLSSCGETVTTTVKETSTKTVPTTVTVGEGTPITVTETKTVDGSGGTATVTETKTVTDNGGSSTSSFKIDKTVLKTFGLNGFANGGAVACVDVKDGKWVRTRPLHFDEKYTESELNPFIINARGKTFKKPLKSAISYFSMAYKQRVYSPTRILYPLQRVDWEPGGDPAKINAQNRGKSKYKRISWDTATDIIASELKRIQETYGAYSILGQGDGHGEAKCVQGAHGCQFKLLDLMGGYTLQVRNADSWEGWYWGTKHVWGQGAMGLLAPSNNSLYDCLLNTEMMIFMGSDHETTGNFNGQDVCIYDQWLKAVGIKFICISPDCNYSTAIHADKWIPVLPNTDAALQLAIIYTWIKEDSYDKDYIATHTVGFDDYIKPYVMGDEDGIEKSPEWASPLCGVPEWTIKALARAWATKVTSVGHNNGGGMIRGPYSHEAARFEAVLLAMQGLGKPGVNQVHHGYASPPNQTSPSLRSASQVWWYGVLTPQIIPKPLVMKAILNPPVESWGSTLLGAQVADQFVKYTYPIDEADGGTRIHGIWCDNPCYTACWNNSFMCEDAFRDPSIEFFLIQHPWMQDDCWFADIILPINTVAEEDDIMAGGGCLFMTNKAIEPIGESKTDYEAVCEVARKVGLYDEYTDGQSIEEKIKYGWEISGCKDFISFEDLNEIGYYMPPSKEGWEQLPAGVSAFYNDPVKNPLATPTGKLELYSAALAEHFPDDEERPPYPKWVTGGPGKWHDESRLGERFKDYPLLMVSNHPRWRSHANCDELPWFREIPTCKVKGYDGYMYEPIWIHPTDADARGIKHGDIIKMYNERGTVLGGAYVTERIIIGAVYQDHGAPIDPITDKLDRGGENNLISPLNGPSPNCWGNATSGFLVEVAKVEPEEMQEWRNNYPEAFNRDYDPNYGLLFSSWIEGGKV